MKPFTEKEFIQFTKFIKRNYGVNLLHKKTLVIGRLQNYIMQQNFKSFSDYFDFVMSDKTGKAAASLVNKITTNHTFFMREPKHFEYFKSHVLPGLVIREQKRKDLRIWSAGCSTGEEPFTLAMIIDEYFGDAKLEWNTKILATDISGKALDIAKKGEYESERVSSLPASWRLNYFKKLDNGRYAISDRIKNEVIFRRFNLMETDFPFKRRFHVIFCRNVMIYFDAKTRAGLIEKFYNITKHEGYLFIGHSESINREQTNYKYVMPAVYRK